MIGSNFINSYFSFDDIFGFLLENFFLIGEKRVCLRSDVIGGGVFGGSSRRELEMDIGVFEGSIFRNGEVLVEVKVIMFVVI